MRFTRPADPAGPGAPDTGPADGGGEPSPPPPSADTTAPALAGVSLSRSRFRVARRATATVAAAHAGTTLRFTLSEAARVRIALRRVRSGRVVRAGALLRSEPAGAGRVRFSGRVGKRALRPGPLPHADHGDRRRGEPLACDRRALPHRASRLSGRGAPAGARNVAAMLGQRDSTAFRTLSDVVLAIAAEREVEPVLRKLVHAARELGGARYAALGVPDGEGGFARFITSGMSDELIAAMGPLPRTHGLLGAMLESPDPYRTADIHRHERFRGWWPGAHPDMRSFLGVPIVARGGIIGALYLTEKEGGADFSDADERLIVLLAAHAAIAIENARLHERSRELSIVEERNRLARELHDSVTQQLFGVVLAAQSACELLERGGAAGEQLERVQALARGALEELRSVVFELRPASLEAEGLSAVLRKHVDVLRRVTGRTIELRVTGSPSLGAAAAGQVFRIAQEALQNALRHSEATRISVRLEEGGGRLRLTVADDGHGFDASAPGLRGRRLGLTSMEERAAELGGRLTVDAAPGAGTTVALELAA
jgi:signal transduction histidine kinase